MEPWAAALLTFLVVVNNSLVLMGPSAWSGFGARRAAAIYAAFSSAGALTPWMPRVEVGLGAVVFAVTMYVVFLFARVSIPLSVLVYAMGGAGPSAVAAWLASPIPAMVVAPLVARRPRLARVAVAPLLASASFAFGANNLAMFVHDGVSAASVIAADVAASAIGARYSVWIAEAVGVGRVVASATNASIMAGVLMGMAIGVPMSVTLLAYSALLSLAATSPLRITKVGRLVSAYVALLAAIAASQVYRLVESFF